jgi:hypothetical protein
LPQNLQKAIEQRQQKLYVEVDEDKLLLSLGNEVAQREILRLGLDTADAEEADIPREVQQTIVLVPDDKVLAKRISLPAAAEGRRTGQRPAAGHRGSRLFAAGRR